MALGHAFYRGVLNASSPAEDSGANEQGDDGGEEEGFGSRSWSKSGFGDFVDDEELEEETEGSVRGGDEEYEDMSSDWGL